MRTIRSVSIGSAFKMSATLNALVYAIVGGIGLVLVLLGSMLAIGSGGMDMGMGGFGLVGAIVGYIIGIVVVALVGGIIGALYALIYNIVAGIAGGLQIEIE